jgi:hypothetical protein
LFIDEFSWDNGPTRKVLWAQEHNTNPIRIYQLNPVTGVATFQFAAGSSIGIFRDGIAYDASDDSLWISGDISTVIDHVFATTGLPAFPPQITPKDAGGANLGSISGVQVGVGDLYLGRNGLSQIVRVRKTDGAFISSFASPGGVRDEGLECDAVNFAPTLALWSREFNFPGFMAVIELEPGTCACQQACGTCDGTTVVVNQNVTVDFNPAIPTCSGDPALCAFFTYSKGPNPDTWKAIFDVGAKKLLVKSGATITVNTVPLTGNNRRSPGIEIRSTCDLEVEQGGAIVVQSQNQQAGDIFIQVTRDITINGTVSNSVVGTNGRPGNITIASCCGDITTGPKSVIQTIGQDFGGSDINLLACEGGDITISGLVDASYKGGTASTINIASFGGNVTIDGNNFLGIEAGTQRPITSGVTVRSRRDPLTGKIRIQADKDITVFGNRILDRLHPNFGAVAVKTVSTNGSSGAGEIVAVSVSGKIVASNRAFDIANRFNGLNSITLNAKGDINLSVTAPPDDGASSIAKPVVNSQGGDTGKGGTNRLRSFSGGINIGVNAQVLANFVGRPGSNGTNLLTSCTGVSNLGTGNVNPSDLVTGDDIGVCSPAAPEPLFHSCADFGACALPPGACLPTSSLGVLISGSIVTAYVPNGNWISGATGIQVVRLEGPATLPATIATPDVVNSCSSNSVTGETICTANTKAVYKITGSTLGSTLMSGATGTAFFSGGNCMTCGVIVDTSATPHPHAILEVGLSGDSGYQFLDLVTNVFAAPIPSGNGSFFGISENIAFDPIHHLLLSPNELGNYQIVNTSSATPALFNNVVGGPFLDSAAEDCTTQIALATVEFTATLFIADLSQAMFTPGTPGTWTAPSQFQFFPDFAPMGAGTSGIALAPGSHLGVVTGEFGGNRIGVIQLPSTSGSGTPAVCDWAAFDAPNDPAGNPFVTGCDPHVVTAYVSPNTGKAMAVVATTGPGGCFSAPTYLALIDLQALLAAPRVAGTHLVTSLPAGAVTFVKTT